MRCDKLVVLVVCFVVSTSKSYAFPDFIKNGYQSCKSCHFDNTGGGPLTPYGRTIAEEKLAMFAFKSEGEAFYGKLGLAPFDLAGDFRYLVQRYQDDTVRLTQRFPMQREVSLSFQPVAQFAAVASVGLYGFEASAPEYRRYYGKLTLGGFSFRLGRFLPAFGVNIPDHTKATRSDLFGQGRESFNAEAAYTHRYFEIIGTRLLGRDTRFEVTKDPRVVQTDDFNGAAIRISVFPTKGIQAGYSLFRSDNFDGTFADYSAYHVFLGVNKVWVFAEFQSRPDGSERAYGYLGTEFMQGLWTKIEINQQGGSGESLEVFTTMQFFPRPHLEFSASQSKRQSIFIFHWYI